MRSVIRLLVATGERLAVAAVLVMVAASLAVVFLRFLGGIGQIGLQELPLWLHALAFLLAAAAALRRDAHVRVEIVAEKMPHIVRGWVEILGFFALLLPMLAVIAWSAWPPIVRSWQSLEASPAAGGLPGLFLLKSLVLLFCILLTAQGWQRACLAWHAGRDQCPHGSGDESRG